MDHFDFLFDALPEHDKLPALQGLPRAYETAFALKAEGKVRHVGISFHDRAAVLEQILTDYPAIEVADPVQLSGL